MTLQLIPSLRDDLPEELSHEPETPSRENLNDQS